MPALNADRDTRVKDYRNFAYGARGNVQFYHGQLVCLDAGGFLVPGATATTLKAVGRCRRNVLTAAPDGTTLVKGDTGTFRWDNSAAGDAIALTDVGNPCYIVDDHTVAKTNGGATRSFAGTIVDVDAVGVWVKTGIVAG